MYICLLLLLFVSCLSAQIRPNLMEEAGKDNLPSQKLGADDLVAVSVYDAPELTRTVRIESDGTIRLPLLKQGVTAAGEFPRTLEANIADALTSEEILVDPVVKVTVVEYHSRPISVIGAVKKPLTFQSVGSVTVVDALARAEGLTNDAGTEILLTLPASTGEAARIERIPVKRLLRDADSSVNFTLHGGEEIRVPEASRIFVVGNVKKPGGFPVREEADTSVLRLVALSEGLLPFSSKLAYIYRLDAAGAKQEIPVELEKILRRKSPDVPLQADDVFYVPDNRTRRNVATAIDRIANFGSSTASGLLIWR
jgi:polysaccharide export outer membrane protein